MTIWQWQGCVARQALLMELDILSGDELAERERQINRAITDEVKASERRTPGYLAARLLAQIDDYPLLACGIPACMTGGNDLMDYVPRRQADGVHYIESVLWPKKRKEFRDSLPQYICDLAASKCAMPVADGRKECVFKIVISTIFLLWIRKIARSAQRVR